MRCFGVLPVFLMLSAFAVAEPIPFYDYDDAVLINEEQRQTNSYLLALDTYEKTENRWHPQESLRLRGQLSRKTWELPRGTDERRVIEFYREQVPAEAEVLFSCLGRDCGESNNWANDHFGIKQLYGLDEYQFYGAYKISPADYLTLYVVRRGNRRVYVHIEHLSSQ